MIIAVVGPTGVGKTKLSIALAKKYDGIIINCDAVQVYKELNIGSAKIKEEEKEGIPHFLLDIVSPNEQYTVYDYQKDIRNIINNNSHKNIIIVGGTGLYLKAGLYDYQFSKEDSKENFENLSNDEIYALALQKDANCKIHPNNRQRLIRFLNREKNCTNSEPLYDVLYIGLTTDREVLYQKINERVDEMIKSGLIEEVNYLDQKYPHAKILENAIGYKEIKKYIQKQVSLEETINDIKKNSRHYAKRQYTFFKNQLPITWFNVDYDNFDHTIAEVLNYLNKKNS